MGSDDDFIIPDTPAFNNVLLGEINSNLKDIKALLQEISEKQESIKVANLNITLGSMIGLALKWLVATMLISIIVFFIILAFSAISFGQLLSF